MLIHKKRTLKIMNRVSRPSLKITPWPRDGKASPSKSKSRKINQTTRETRRNKQPRSRWKHTAEERCYFYRECESRETLTPARIPVTGSSSRGHSRTWTPKSCNSKRACRAKLPDHKGLFPTRRLGSNKDRIVASHGICFGRVGTNRWERPDQLRPQIARRRHSDYYPFQVCSE